jgi:hypothetical protein
MRSAEEILGDTSCQLDEFDNVLFDKSDVIPAMNDYGDQYRHLLVKYIEHVKSCEGIDYINNGETHSEVQFTQSELDLLKLLAGNPTF